MKIIRATELWQQAGAYYVRIQGMARQHGITLDREFDADDTPDTKYIVALDGDFPVATCRILNAGESGAAVIGRVVVLEEYRGKGLGSLVVSEAEKWIAELGFDRIFVESRDVAVGFYEKLGYSLTGAPPEKGNTFTCIHMEKNI